MGGHGQLFVAAAHEDGQLLVDDLDDLLGGGQALQHVRAYGALSDLGDKILDHAIADVGVQQGQTHLAHSLLDVGLGNAPLAAQTSKRGVQFFGKALKCHRLSLLPTLSVPGLTGRSCRPGRRCAGPRTAGS